MFQLEEAQLLKPQEHPCSLLLIALLTLALPCLFLQVEGLPAVEQGWSFRQSGRKTCLSWAQYPDRHIHPLATLEGMQVHLARLGVLSPGLPPGLLPAFRELSAELAGQ